MGKKFPKFNKWDDDDYYEVRDVSDKMKDRRRTRKLRGQEKRNYEYDGD